MTSPKGNKVANQFIISDDLGNTFFNLTNQLLSKNVQTAKYFLMKLSGIGHLRLQNIDGNF